MGVVIAGGASAGPAGLVDRIHRPSEGDAYLAKAKILEGVLESIGPGEQKDGSAMYEYIDIGGKRVNKIGWSNEMGYQIERAVGKPVRLALFGPTVAAAEVGGVVTRESKKFPLGLLVLAVMVSLACGILGSFVSMFMAFASLRPVFPWTPVVISQIPAVLVLLYHFSCRSGFEEAKNALDGAAPAAPVRAVG